MLVGSPWSSFPKNRMGDVFKQSTTGSTPEKLDLPASITIPDVTELKNNMSLGLTLVRNPKTGGFLACGPLWAQTCGRQNYVTGVCSDFSPSFQPLRSFSPAVQNCSSFMDIVIVLDGSNSIWPWNPIQNFLEKLIQGLNIGPKSAQVSIVQYANNPRVEFNLNSYTTKEELVKAATKITQMSGDQTNTFKAINYARQNLFSSANGGRKEASKVMVVVTDGESHDNSLLSTTISACDQERITRFGIAVLGYYIRNQLDTEKLINEIKSIASNPTEKYFFNVSEEKALLEIAGTLGERIFSIEATCTGGKESEALQMEMSQVGFSAHYSKKEDVLMLGAVGAYGWSGTVVHQTPKNALIFPKQAFEKILEDKNHSSYLGYSVTTLTTKTSVLYVAGAPRSNHTGQVVVYSVSGEGSVTVLQSKRGDQIGSYFGSVLCSVDVNKDSFTDVLLVGAPMFMNELKKEEGLVYMFSVHEGNLGQQETLQGSPRSENARFGSAIAVVSDIDLDGDNDVIIGAPLEDENHGAIYIYNGDKTTIQPSYSQKILASAVNKRLQYFGRSVDGQEDLNSDTITDVSVGAYGQVVQFWSRSIAHVSVKVTFIPDHISIGTKNCTMNIKMPFCFQAKICFSAKFRPTTANKEVVIQYNATLDADLQSSRVISRGLFKENGDRSIEQENIIVKSTGTCFTLDVHGQEASDLISSLGLRVDISLQTPTSGPVLDVRYPVSSEYFIPFEKECGEDKLCLSDLVLQVEQKIPDKSQTPYIINNKNRGLTFTVKLSNKKENAYNTKMLFFFSKNLYYASSIPLVNDTKITCRLDTKPELVCHVGYPVLQQGQEVSLNISFDFNFNQLQNAAQISIQAKSESEEWQQSDNMVNVSIPIKYDAEIHFTRSTSITFYEIKQDQAVQYTVDNYDDIGPEFNFTLKVTKGRFPVSIANITVGLPVSTTGKNPLLYLTGVDISQPEDVTCEISKQLNPLKIGEKPYTATFTKENFRNLEELSCKTAKCEFFKCWFKNLKPEGVYSLNITTRVWNETFAVSSFQSVRLIANAEIDTDKPELLIITNKRLTIPVTISKPGAKGEVPVGVIIGSIIGGLLLLAALVAALWKFGFFQRKYEKLMKEAEDNGEIGPLQD
uniref:Integrin subunit alpha 2 n=1 Tax=Latimeria chalumnae TaxID=7897 RepID=H3B0E3_LATCH